MKKSLLFLALFFIGLAGDIQAQLSPQITDRLSFVMDSVCKKLNLKGASTAVLFPGLGVWNGVHGESYAGKPVHSDMYFGMGSNTKTHIAALLLKMQEQGLLSLDDTIGKWIQGYPNINGKATIRQCLNHSSGIYDYLHNSAINDSIFGNPAKIWTREEMLYLAKTPNFAPGTSWSYSNTNYLIAGIIIQQVLNKSPFTALEDRILKPHNLNHTFDYGKQTSGEAAHPWSGVLNNVMEDMTETPYLNNLFSLANTAGSLITTAEDNVQFWHKLYSGEIINTDSWKEMTQMIKLSGGVDYGLGIFRYNKMMNGRTVYSHGGTFFGYINENMVDDASGICISVLTNQDSIDNNILLGTLIRALHKATMEINASGIEKLSKGNFVVYPNPASQTLTIRQEKENDIASAIFVNTTGKVVMKAAIDQEEQSVQIGELPEGLYFVYLKDSEGKAAGIEKVSVVR